MGSTESCETFWGPIPALPLEELLLDLSVEEQGRVQSKLREEERIRKQSNRSPQVHSMHRRLQECDNCITDVARHAIRHYNARHPGDEFDAVKSLMESTVRFRGELWYHINFWARSHSSNKIKRFFAEVHYKQTTSSSVRSNPESEVHDRRSAGSFAFSDQPVAVPEAEILNRPLTSSSVRSNPPVLIPESVRKRLSARRSVYSEQPVQVPEAEVHDRQSASSFACSDHPVPVPEAEMLNRPPASSSNRIPIIEVCTIIEEPLGRYRRSCAFCRGHLDIFHPKGSRKFVCGNDKDRMVQQLVRGSNHGCGKPCK